DQQIANATNCVEIGVASTKAFTTQLVALAIFTLVIVKLKNSLTDQQIANATNCVEIGVASTKAFTTQLVALAIFTLVIVKLKNS
ncbi:hypothetical protein IBE76_10195, partial [Francisella tularensis]|uniref:hypothetical protein n=1 Tax=Francisella tularensis TaxID=263 RepID=UPI001C0F198F